MRGVLGQTYTFAYAASPKGQMQIRGRPPK